MLSFNLSKQALKDLQVLKGGLSKDGYSILNNYYCKVSNGCLQVVVSNEKFYIEKAIAVNFKANSEIAFLAQPDFFDINVKTNANFTIDINNQKVIIEADNLKTSKEIKGVEGYPVFNQEIDNLIGTIKSNELLQLLKVKNAVSKDEQYETFQGVLFDIQNNTFNSVATDRSQLYWFAYQADFKDFYGVINSQSINILIKLLSKYKDNVYIHTDNEYISFLIDKTKLITRIIKDRFPQYQAVLLENGSNVNSIILNKTQLINAISGLITKETIAINVKFTSDKMILSTDNAEATVNYQNNTDNDITSYNLAINGKYTIDFLKTLPNDIDNITFYFKEPIKPLEMRASNFILVMTPVRQ
jgi:DNA polymerase III sliding clamp (beta) subunit (PCNA family)